MSVPSMSSYQAMQAMGQAGVHDGARPRVGLRRPSEFCLGGGYHHSNRSVPGPMRNISFNSQVQFYDVWSSMDYDRRGEIATCNRLTPDLAQQIKEELNSLKMVRLFERNITFVSVFHSLTPFGLSGNGSSRNVPAKHAILLKARFISISFSFLT